MRRLTKIGAASAVLVVALAGCAQEEGSTGNASEDLCAGDGDGPKVGLAYDVGGRGDQSFNDAAAAGRTLLLSTAGQCHHEHRRGRADLGQTTQDASSNKPRR